MDKIVRKILEIGGDRVLFILLYGSRARGDVRADSDVDIAVYYEGDERERFRFRVRVAGELPENDIHTFQDLPLHVIRQALREGKLLYVRDREKAQRILLKASRDAEDFEHRLRIILVASKARTGQRFL